jgi:hypothetical protein
MQIGENALPVLVIDPFDHGAGPFTAIARTISAESSDASGQGAGTAPSAG